MSLANFCPRCQKLIPDDAPHRICPACLLQAGLSEDSLPHATEASMGTLPDNFGDYEFIGELGRGGMGVVYLATQKSLGRAVALKMLLGSFLADAEALRRFRDEAETAARLDHPNIVPIYEVGEQRGHPYFSMKRIEGQSLTKCLDRYLTDPKAAVELLIKVCQGVHHAHQRGVLHRDLKPGNILVDAAGEPHITDFGLARRIEEARGNTRSGIVVGTPESMAPEQAAGAKDLTTAVDVYGLGAILYSLLTGRSPFQAESVYKTLRAVIEEAPIAPRRLRPEVPRDLEVICLKCLFKEPAKRYASADALAQDLARWLKGEPIVARRVGRLERYLLWARRKPLAAALLQVSIFSFLLILGNTALFTWQLRRTNAQLTESNENLAKTTNDLKATIKQRDSFNRELEDSLWLSRREVFNLQMTRVAACFESDPKTALELLHDYNACPINERDTAWRYYEKAALANYRPSEPGILMARGSLIDGRSGLHDWERPNETHQGRQWAILRAGASPTKTQYDRDAKTSIVKLPLQIVDLISGDVQVTLPENVSSRFLHFGEVVISQDGSTIAWMERHEKRQNHIMAYDALSDKLLDPKIEINDEWPEYLVLSSNGRQILLKQKNHADGKNLPPCVYDLHTGKVLHQLAELPYYHHERTGHPQFSPDGKTLAYQIAPEGKERALCLLDTTTFALRQSIPLKHGVEQFVFSPESKHLLVVDMRLDAPFGRSRAHLSVYELGDEPKLKQSFDTQSERPYFHFSPDGRFFGMMGRDNDLLVFETKTWKLKRTLSGVTPWNFVFRNDGNQLVSMGISLRAYDVETGESRVLRQGDFGILLSLNERNELRSQLNEYTFRGNRMFVWNLNPKSTGKTVPDVVGRKVSRLEFADNGRELIVHATLTLNADDNTIYYGSTESIDKSYANPPKHLPEAEYSINGRWLYDVKRTARFNLATATTTYNQDPYRAWPEERAVAKHIDPHGDEWKLESGSDQRTQFSELPRLINVRTGQIRQLLISDYASKINLGTSPDGQSLLLGTNSGVLELWDVWTGKLRASLSGHSSSIVNLAWSQDGHRMATSSMDGTIKIWDFHTTALGQWNDEHRLAFTPEGNLAFGTNDETAIIDMNIGRADVHLNPQWHRHHGERLFFTPDGKYQISGSNHSVVVHAATGGAPALASSDDKIHLWTPAPDGSFVACVRITKVAGKGDSWEIVVSRMEVPNLTERELFRIPRPNNLRWNAERLQITGNSREIVLSYEYSMWKWIDAETGTLLREKQLELIPGSVISEHVLAPLLHPDGNLVLSRDEKGWFIWDSAADKLKWRLPVQSFDYRCAAFISDGRWLAVGDSFGIIRVFVVETGEVIRLYNSRDVVAGSLIPEIRSIFFDPKNHRIAARVLFGDRARSWPSRIVVWDLDQR